MIETYLVQALVGSAVLSVVAITLATHVNSKVKQHNADLKAQQAPNITIHLQQQLKVAFNIIEELQTLPEQVEQAHVRIGLANIRSQHIEHYLGLRHHKFQHREVMWAFKQAHSDIKNQTTPKGANQTFKPNLKKPNLKKRT